MVDGAVSVLVEIAIDKTQYEQDIAQLQQNKPILPVYLQIDNRQINEFEKQNSIILETYLDLTQAQKQLDEFVKQNITIGVEVKGKGGIGGGGGDCCEAIISAFKDLQTSIRETFREYSIGISEAIKDASNQQQKTAERIFNAESVANQTKDVLGFITAPFRSITRGLFEGVGEGFSRSFTSKLISGLERELNISFKHLGERFGTILGKKIDKFAFDFFGKRARQNTTVTVESMSISGNEPTATPLRGSPDKTPPVAALPPALPPMVFATPRPVSNPPSNQPFVTPVTQKAAKEIPIQPSATKPVTGEQQLEEIREEYKKLIEDNAYTFSSKNPNVMSALRVTKKLQTGKPVPQSEAIQAEKELTIAVSNAQKVSRTISKLLKRIDGILSTETDREIRQKASQYKATLSKTRNATNDVSKSFSADAQKAGLNIGQGVTQGIKSQKNEAEESIKEVGKGVINAFKKQNKIESPSKVFFDAAVWCIKGIISGFKSEEKNANKTSQESATGLIKSFNKTLGINSISKVFFKAGTWCLKGLVAGFKSENVGVQLAIKELGNALEDSLSTVFGSIGHNIFGGISSGMETHLTTGIPSIGKKIGWILLKATKEILGIRSPSTEYEEVMLNVLRGMIKGGKHIEKYLREFVQKYRKAVDETQKISLSLDLAKQVKESGGTISLSVEPTLIERGKAVTEAKQSGRPLDEQLFGNVLPKTLDNAVKNRQLIPDSFKSLTAQEGILATTLKGMIKGFKGDEKFLIAFAKTYQKASPEKRQKVLKEIAQKLLEAKQTELNPDAFVSELMSQIAKQNAESQAKHTQKKVSGKTAQQAKEAREKAQRATRKAQGVNQFTEQVTGNIDEETKELIQELGDITKEALNDPEIQRFRRQRNNDDKKKDVDYQRMVDKASNVAFPVIRNYAKAVAKFFNPPQKRQNYIPKNDGQTFLGSLNLGLTKYNQGGPLQGLKIDPTQEMKEQQELIKKAWEAFKGRSELMQAQERNKRKSYVESLKQSVRNPKQFLASFMPGQGRQRNEEISILQQLIPTLKQSIVAQVKLNMPPNLSSAQYKNWVRNQVRNFQGPEKGVLLEASKRLKELENQPPTGFASLRNILESFLKSKRLERNVKRLDEKIANDLGTQFDNVFRRINTIIRRKLLKGMSGQEKDTALREGAGFVLAGATMTNPLLVLKALAIPLVTAMSPLIIGFMGLRNVLEPLVRSVAETLKFFEPIKRRFEIGAGSKEKGAEQMRFLEQTASDYKTPLKGSLEQFSRFNLAVMNTPLEGEKSKEFFEALTVAIKGIGLSAEESSRVFLAFNQIIQKGKLSAEEVRQQLAETGFPIFEFAKALNVSLPEFNALLERGALSAADVFPKLSKQLIKDFGESAKQATDGFTSGLIAIENALFRIQKEIGETFGGLFSLTSNVIAKTIEFFASQLKLLTSLALAALIGFTAQIIVGSQAILFNSKLGMFIKAGQMFVTKAVAVGITSTSPFLVGVLADVFDDVLGADYSVFDNLTAFFKNFFIAVTYFVDGLAASLSGTMGWLSAFGESVISAGKGLKAMFEIIPSGVIELTAMTLILIQMGALFQLYLIPSAIQFGKVLIDLTKASWLAVASGKGLAGIWGTLTGGISMLGVAVSAALSVLVLLLAKSDILNELWLPIKQFNHEINSSIKTVISTLELLETQANKTGKSLNDALNQPIKELPSKGLELNPLVLFGGNSFKSDDLMKSQRKRYEKGGFSPTGQLRYEVKAYDAARQKEQVDNLGLGQFINPNYKLTTAEKQLIQNASRLQEVDANTRSFLLNSALIEGNKKTGYTPKLTNTLTPEIRAIRDKIIGTESASQSEIMALINKRKDLKLQQEQASPDGKAAIERELVPVNEQLDKIGIDNQILALRKLRKELGSINTTESRKQIGELDKQIQELQDERKTTVAPLATITQQVDDQIELYKEMKREIENDKNLTPDVKRALLKQLQPGIDALNQAKRALDEGGFTSAVNELETAWKDVTKALSDANVELERWERNNQLSTLNLQKQITEKNLPEKEQSRQLNQLALADEQLKLSQMERMQQQRKATLDELLSIPVAVGSEQEKEVKELQELVNKTEIEIAQKRLEIAQKSASLRTEIEQEAINKIKRAQELAIESLNKASQSSVIEILVSQGVGDLSPERSDFLVNQANRDLTKKQLTEEIKGLELVNQKTTEFAQKRIKEAEQRYEQGKLNQEELTAITQEQNTIILQSEKTLTEAKIKLLNEELAARKEIIAERIRQNNYALDRDSQLIGESLEGQPKLINDAEIEIQLRNIATMEKSLRDIGKTDPVQSRELVRQIRERKEGLVLLMSAQKSFDIEQSKSAKLRQAELQKQAGLEAESNVTRLTAELNATKALKQLKESELKSLDELNLSKAFSDRNYGEKRRAMLTELSNLETQMLSTQGELVAAQRDAQLKLIEREIEYRKALREILRLELDQRKELLQAVLDLGKANRNLRTGRKEGEISIIDKLMESNADKENKAVTKYKEERDKKLTARLGQILGVNPNDDLALLRQRDKLESQIANEKLEALREEQRIQREILEIEQKQSLEAKKEALEQAKLNELTAEQNILKAQKAILEAKNPQELAIAERGLEIASKGFELAKLQTKNRENALKSETKVQGMRRKQMQGEQTETLRDQSREAILANPSSLPKVNPLEIRSPRFMTEEEKERIAIRKARAARVRDMDDLTREYGLNPTPQRELKIQPIDKGLSPFEQQLIDMLRSSTKIEKVEFNNSYSDNNQEALLRQVRTQTVRDLNKALEGL